MQSYPFIFRSTRLLFALIAGVVYVQTAGSSTGPFVASTGKVSNEVSGYTVKTNPAAKEGTCMPSLKGNPADILNKAYVTATGAKPAELSALAKGYQQLAALGGPGATAAGGVNFSFTDAYGASDQTVSGINIRRSGLAVDDNVAHLMHEAGHKVGNTAGFYARYNAEVPASRCQVSGYCNKHTKGGGRNEEFAEVFAAYVTHPDLLVNAGSNCREAYEFMKNVVFANPQAAASCSNFKGDTMVASATENSPGSMFPQPSGVPPAQDSESKARSAALNCPPQGMTKVRRRTILGSGTEDIVQAAAAINDEAHAADENTL